MIPDDDDPVTAGDAGPRNGGHLGALLEISAALLSSSENRLSTGLEVLRT